MLRALGVLATVALLTSCSGSGAGDGAAKTVTIGGETVAVARLVDAHAALCEAAKQPESARRLFFDRSHEAMHTVARALDPVDRAQEGALLQGKEKVEAELAVSPPSLPEDLLKLADIYRAGLGRLAIAAPPCEK